MTTEILHYVLTFAGLMVLGFGYRKTNRKLMLTGALVLWFGTALPDMVSDFKKGYQEEMSKNTDLIKE